jgi:hypothetical protein
VKFTFTVLIARTQTQSNFCLQDSKFRVDDSANWPLNQGHVWIFELHFVWAFCSYRKLILTNTNYIMSPQKDW